MNKDSKHLIDLFKHNRYEIISERMIEVDGKIVSKKKYLTCECENQSFTGQNGICRHKQFFIVLPILKHLEIKLDSLLEYYRTGKTIANSEEKKIYEQIIEDLKSIRRMD